MTAELPFQSPYRHGFVRVAVAAPRLHLAQPAANAEETVRLARIADERGAALVVFPELGLSAYSADDLFHQQALLDAVRDAVATAGRRQRRPRARCWSSGAPLLHEAKLFNCARGRPPRPRARRRAQDLPAELPRVLREAAVHSRRDGAHAPRSSSPASSVPFGADLVFRARDRARRSSFYVEICEDLWVPVPPSTWAALAGRHGPLQPVGEQHHDRQGRLPRAAVRVAVGPLHRRLPLRRRRPRRVDHRPGLGRPRA